jgi:hypothetical protein
VIADLDVGDALADGLNNSTSLVPEDRREHALGVVTRKLKGDQSSDDKLDQRLVVARSRAAPEPDSHNSP